MSYLFCVTSAISPLKRVANNPQSATLFYNKSTQIKAVNELKGRK